MDVRVLVIGGGQAGLAAAYWLKRYTIAHWIVDKGQQVGESWERRYDSLQLFTPRSYNLLPGMELPGDSEGLPVKDEIAAALRHYQGEHQLPLTLNSEVVGVERASGRFRVETTRGDYTADAIIVATGPFQKPLVPPISTELSTKIRQLHSNEYRRPGDLKPGVSLVVGGGNSGAQIAVELSAHGPVMLSAAQPPLFMPLTIGGKNVFWWLDKLRLLSAPADSYRGRKIRSRPDPVFGKELQHHIREGAVTLKPRTVGVQAGERVQFADGTAARVDNIVWATGFQSDYGWLHVDGALDQQGKPLHRRGVSPVAGLYYVGLPWQTSRQSALLRGVGKDAEEIVRHIQAEALL
ncbi:flavin-containing monooxygenase [Paenibacillus sp. SYP-B4298]|uniref:flavin-containing monooxygenase n=1 Tax=Paenibacillus sp. SYP-B4298 TaxID=2996034 RepID=UPI0022DDF760|nr:NAD(P)/FAD-dependent oxidoreductase [Paenibacillus sp. SYP-B4298]